MASKFYDFTLAAAVGASQRLDVRGGFCKLTAATSAVIVRADTGEEWALLPGQGFRIPGPNGFQALTIRNVLGNANVGTLFIGDSLFEDSRISGAVTLIDEITDNIITGAFTGSTAITTLVWQPMLAAASNVRGCLVRQFSIGGTPGGAGGTLNLQLVAAKSQPPAGSTGYTLPAQRFNMAAAYNAAGLVLLVQDAKLNKFLPAGWGVYFGFEIATTNALTAPNAALGYELQ